MGRRTHRIILTVLAAAALLCAAGCACYGIRFRHYISYCRSVDVSLSQAAESFGKPNSDNEWAMATVLAADKGNWLKVKELTADDRHSTFCSYYHNLANAKLGSLSDGLLSYYQPFERGLFLPVQEDQTPFVIGCASEVWWQLGAMTQAEHAAILGMTFSPNHKGERYMRRLAEINLVNGDEAAAAKYLAAMRRQLDDGWKEKIPLKPAGDTLVLASDYRGVLLNLLEGNPANTMAYEYLLCLDLLTKDIVHFMEDYDPEGIRSKVYDEVALVGLAMQGRLSDETAGQYGISSDMAQEFFEYTDLYQRGGGQMAPLQDRFGKTYWFFYHFAKRNG